MADVTIKGPASRRELLVAVALAATVVSVWLVVAASTGALGIARNDDWSFIENAFRFADTGVVAVGGWVQMTLIGQLVLTLPVLMLFGDSIVALQLLVAVLAVLMLVSSYLVLRNFLAMRGAVFAVGILAISGMFGLLTASFMTDIPAAAFQLATLGLGYRALRSEAIRWPWLMTASVVGLFAVSIREYAVVALGAVWVVAWRRSGAVRSIRPFIVWTLALVLAGVLLLLWRSEQVTVTDSPLGFNLLGVRYVTWWPLTAGWLLLPALAMVNPLKLAPRAWQSSKALFVLIMAFVIVALAHTRFGFLGNYLSLTGGYSEVIRGVPTPVLAPWWSGAVTATAVYGSIVLGLVLVVAVRDAWRGRSEVIRRPVSSTSLAVTFMVLTVVIYAITPIVADVALFDRYFIALVPIASGLLLWWIHREGLMWLYPGIPATAVFVGVALTNLVLVGATSALDSARWRLGDEAALNLDVARGNVDAGFDYFSFNTNGSPRPDGVRWTWWTAQLGDRAVCATVMYSDYGVSDVAAGPEPDQIVLAEESVNFPWANPQRLVVFAGPDRC